MFRRFPVAAMVLTLAAPLFAADPVPAVKVKVLTPAERIRKAFDEKITIDITEQPLFLALNQLREQTKINFVLDRQTLQNMGQDPESLPVTARIKDMKVGDALKTIIKDFNLGYAIIGDAVYVSTNEMAMQRQLKQHVSIDLEKIELAKALEQLKKETATNIVLDKKAEKEGKTLVTMQLDDVPLESAVRLLAEMAGLKAVRPQGSNVLYVTPRGNATELRQSGMAAPEAVGDFDGRLGGRRIIRNFQGGGIAIFDDGGVIAGPIGLPLTEPLSPAPKTEEKKP
jgi:hypothetical protein